MTKTLDIYEVLQLRYAKTGDEFYKCVMDELSLHRNLPEENIKLKFKLSKMKQEFIEREAVICDHCSYDMYECEECEYFMDGYGCGQCPICCGCQDE